MAHIGEIAEALYGKGTQSAHHAHMQKVEEEIAAAKRFKREQEAIPDLTPNELAHDFLAMLPPGDTATVSFDQRPVYEPQPADDVHGAPAPGSANAPNGEKKGGPGRDNLDRAEEIYRLAKAQEAMEKKTEAREKTGKEIAKEIQWRPGWDLKGVKLLEDARHRLKRVVDAKDEATLNEIAEFRKEKKTIRYPLFHSLHT